MRVLLVAAAMLCSFVGATAQWAQLPFPGESDFRALTFADSLHGWCVASSFVSRTADGGQTWINEVQPTLNKNLNDVVMQDTLTGWIVGESGTILRRGWKPGTVGVQWHQMPSGTEDNLLGVFFLDGSRGWACGSNGIILSTTDAGSTWSQQHRETDSWKSLNAIYFTDSLHGWATGYVTLRTDDGGLSWSQVTLPTTEEMWDVLFLNRELGLITGRIGTILRTTDEGNTWETVSSNTGVFLHAMAFVSETEGWITGGGVHDGNTWQDSARVLHTADAGLTWQHESLPVDVWLADITATDREHVWIAGENGTVLKRAYPTSVKELTTETSDRDAAGYDEFDLLGRAITYGHNGCIIRRNRATGKSTLIYLE